MYFGTLQHYPANKILRLFDELTKHANLENEISTFPVSTDVHFEFWPKFNRVEPDMVIHFSNNGKPLLHIILEIKWGAKLSPACELIRQWVNRDISDKATWLHLYLVKEKSSGSEEIKQTHEILKEGCETLSCYEKNCPKKTEFDQINMKSKDWEKVLGCISWRDFVAAVNVVFFNDRVSNGISLFFEKQGIISFVGFTWLTNEPKIDQDSKHYGFYQNEPWFNYLPEIEKDFEYGDITFYKN